jgi:hypothetical protein
MCCIFCPHFSSNYLVHSQHKLQKHPAPRKTTDSGTGYESQRKRGSGTSSPNFTARSAATKLFSGTQATNDFYCACLKQSKLGVMLLNVLQLYFLRNPDSTFKPQIIIATY